jgi:hypothetical protein
MTGQAQHLGGSWKGVVVNLDRLLEPLMTSNGSALVIIVAIHKFRNGL